MEQRLAMLEKKLHEMSSENGKLQQRIQNLEAEIFLDTVTAQFPDKVIRERVTLRGTVQKMALALMAKDRPKIHTAKTIAQATN